MWWGGVRVTHFLGMGWGEGVEWGGLQGDTHLGGMGCGIRFSCICVDGNSFNCSTCQDAQHFNMFDMSAFQPSNTFSIWSLARSALLLKTSTFPNSFVSTVALVHKIKHPTAQHAQRYKNGNVGTVVNNCIPGRC